MLALQGLYTNHSPPPPIRNMHFANVKFCKVGQRSRSYTFTYLKSSSDKVYTYEISKL